MDAHTIRQKFLDYFAEHDHQKVRSASLVPQGDPTLYFVNAGMVQFKDVFTGQETRPYTRATSTQKCLRVSGKHNDLENVGRTNRHHTFFEMLGNFSFGDYFKEDAIRYGWEFLTDVMGLDGDRLVGTVFCGEGELPFDEDAHRIWRDDIGLPEERIIRLGVEDNFWSMGDTGPCGPCSELHYLQGADLPCPEDECLGVACECDRWVEVWNLVFMQYNRHADGTLEPLAATGVDTGMGLERLAAVKQGKLSTFDTDLLMPIIQEVAALAGVAYGDDQNKDVSMRVVADHARAAAFCIADGVFPEKGGREYVLRRIMRRAIRHGKLLGFEEPFFSKVCAKVVTEMEAPFPELRERAQLIEALSLAEEESFRRTLGRGMLKLEQEVARAEDAGEKTLPQAFVGDLYATDGFPIDLTRLMAEEHGLTVDEAAAHDWVMRTHGASDTRVGEAAVGAVYKALLEKLGPTTFTGYDSLEQEVKALAMVKEGTLVASAGEGEKVDLITAETPLYGKSGGQVGDTGVVTWEGGEAQVKDTVKLGGALIAHQVEVKSGELKVGLALGLAVDAGRRQEIKLNHSATHLLHHALRTSLGEHVAQKGSEVAPGYLRFDFSHFRAMTPEEIKEVEARVNDEIRRDGQSRTELKSFDEARKQGAMALFGEKYGEEVRMVHIGHDSLELCGGTHVERAGEIGLFRIVSEEALAMGVRRIVAVTGAEAVARGQQDQARLRLAADTLRCTPEQVAERIEKLQAQLKESEREAAGLKKKLATGGGGTNLQDKVQERDGVKFLISRVDAADPKTLRDAGDTLRNWLGSGVLVLGGEHKGKAALLVMVSKDLTDRFHAGKIMKKLAEMLEGRGGGRPDMAQGGGPRVDLLDQALEGLLEQI